MFPEGGNLRFRTEEGIDVGGLAESAVFVVTGVERGHQIEIDRPPIPPTGRWRTGDDPNRSSPGRRAAFRRPPPPKPPSVPGLQGQEARGVKTPGHLFQDEAAHGGP